jgi:hypothetical protein
MPPTNRDPSLPSRNDPNFTQRDDNAFLASAEFSGKADVLGPRESHETGRRLERTRGPNAEPLALYCSRILRIAITKNTPGA